MKFKNVTEVDVERWKKTTADSVSMLLGDIKNGKTQQGRRYHQIYSEYKTIACVEFAQGNVGRVKENLVRSAEAYRKLQEVFASGEEIKKSYITYMDYEAMLIALLGSNIDCARAIAKSFGTLPPEKSDHPYHVHLGLAVKSAILGDVKTALAEIVGLEKQQLSFPEKRNVYYLFRAILSNDSGEVERLIPLSLQDFDGICRREFKGTPYCVLFLEGLGALALNKLINGLLPVLPDDPRLPKFLLQ